MTQIPIEHRPPEPSGAPDPREVFELIERMRSRLRMLVVRASARVPPATHRETRWTQERPILRPHAGA